MNKVNEHDQDNFISHEWIDLNNQFILFYFSVFCFIIPIKISFNGAVPLDSSYPSLLSPQQAPSQATSLTQSKKLISYHPIPRFDLRLHSRKTRCRYRLKRVCEIGREYKSSYKDSRSFQWGTISSI